MGHPGREVTSAYLAAVDELRAAVAAGRTQAAVNLAVEARRLALAAADVTGPRLLFRKSTRARIEQRWDATIEALREENAAALFDALQSFDEDG